MGAGIACITHLFTCVLAMWFTLQTIGNLPRAFFSQDPFHRGPSLTEISLTIVYLLAFGATSARALWRVARGRRILNDARIGEHPVLTTCITLGSLFAHLVVANVFLALWQVYPDFDGNAAGPLMLAAMLYAFALLVGEFVLVGRGRDAPAH